ncbi:methionyl-tRNA formyltransferase [Nonlabens spongiae]|uniref:Methionyl-tRNA formyltransferase n=1 Tax=Nonlabens spongiae TaxID=331648 RepID=A0A1W6MII8_9FLAO|nr:methionyl-tRNA formyltransferase [Nonlabens spongiae]ARN77428.1 methionyl-tRNA formyltransferase [Nonlabens spongiae]
MRDKLKIVFFGTPEFATHILDGIVQSHHQVVGVVTVADKPAGRGRKLQESHVKQYAVGTGLRVLQPTNLKDENFIKELSGLEADLFVIVAFRMLPRVVWDMPEMGTFNLHASLLPQYRGAAPINWAVINQEKKSGVTTFFIDEKIDTGAMILQAECALEPMETAGSLYTKLMHLGRTLTLETIDLIAEGEASLTKQTNYDELKDAPKLTTENTKIDFSKPAQQVDAVVRGLNPFPIAKATLLDKNNILQVKIFETSIVNKPHNMIPGSIVVKNNEIMIACSDSFVLLEKLQLPNKKAMDAKSLLNGYSFSSDARFDLG